jgi:hypothetical protein
VPPDTTGLPRHTENAVAKKREKGKEKEKENKRDRVKERVREWEREKERLREMEKLEEIEKERDEEIEREREMVERKDYADAPGSKERDKKNEDATASAIIRPLTVRPVSFRPTTGIAASSLPGKQIHCALPYISTYLLNRADSYH